MMDGPNDDSLKELLGAWLATPSHRDERVFFLQNTALCDPRIEGFLQRLSDPSATVSVNLREFARRALLIWRRIQRRGADTEAITDAYIDTYTGLSLDIPSWLLPYLPALEGHPGLTAHQRSAQLAECLLRPEMAQLAEPLKAEIVAVYAAVLETLLWIDATATPDAIVQLWQQARQGYESDRYPLQQARLLMNEALARANHPTASQQAQAETATILLEQALTFYQQAGEEHDLAKVYTNLAYAWLKRQQDTPAKRASEAIRFAEAALERRPVDRFPIERAKCLSSLGTAWQQWTGTEHAKEALERAIRYYEDALAIWEQIPSHPVERATTLADLGTAYTERLSQDRSENLERALALLQEAATWRSVERDPRTFAVVWNTIGVIYRHRLAGERRKNLEDALAAYTQALHAAPREHYPYVHAVVLHNIASTLLERMEGRRSANIEVALGFIQQALALRDASRGRGTVRVTSRKVNKSCGRVVLFLLLPRAALLSRNEDKLLVVIGEHPFLEEALSRANQRHAVVSAAAYPDHGVHTD